MTPQICDMHGRRVLLVSIPTINPIDSVNYFEHYRCHDCGQKPMFVVVEVDELEQITPPNQIPPSADSWLWCGRCDIGG
jgi:hypothetical protein